MLYLPTLPGSDSKHGYIVGPIKGNYGFVVKAVKKSDKISAGNVFKCLATAQKPLGGAAMWIWRFQWNEVHNKLAARKPWVALASDIQLEKGKPVKFTWPA